MPNNFRLISQSLYFEIRWSVHDSLILARDTGGSLVVLSARLPAPLSAPQHSPGTVGDWHVTCWSGFAAHRKPGKKYQNLPQVWGIDPVGEDFRNHWIRHQKDIDTGIGDSRQLGLLGICGTNSILVSTKG